MELPVEKTGENGSITLNGGTYKGSITTPVDSQYSNITLRDGTFDCKITGNLSEYESDYGADNRYSTKHFTTNADETGKTLVVGKTGYETVVGEAYISYKPIAYTIYLMNTQGGTLEPPFSTTISFDATNISKNRVTLPKRGEGIVRSGYTFGGWYYDAGCSSQAASYSRGYISISDVEKMMMKTMP